MHVLASSFSHYSSGCYRDAFRFEHAGAEEFVLKRLMLTKKFVWNFKDLGRIQKEAVVMEKLSASPNILDMYSYCGTSVLLEAAEDVDSKMMSGSGYASKKELARLDDVYPANDFTALEKLQIALEMAESLADIHGYKGGEIVHQDINPEQWLVARDGSVKLNDFNIAEISLWDDAAQKFCTRKGVYGGIVSPYEFFNAQIFSSLLTLRFFLQEHSPEEYNGHGVLDHGVDAYSYGNNIYILVSDAMIFSRSKDVTSHTRCCKHS